MVQRNFKNALAMGRKGEDVVFRFMVHGRGCSAMPIYRIDESDGTGPRMRAAEGDVILPDIKAYRNGKSIWVEVKSKTRFTWWGIGKCWETGFDLSSFEQYIQVSQRYREPVRVLFMQATSVPSDDDRRRGCPPECPTGLYELPDLHVKPSHKWPKPPAPMIYWREKDLIRLATLDDLRGFGAAPRSETQSASPIDESRAGQQTTLGLGFLDFY